MLTPGPVRFFAAPASLLSLLPPPPPPILAPSASLAGFVRASASPLAEGSALEASLPDLVAAPLPPTASVDVLLVAPVVAAPEVTLLWSPPGTLAVASVAVASLLIAAPLAGVEAPAASDFDVAGRAVEVVPFAVLLAAPFLRPSRSLFFCFMLNRAPQATQNCLAVGLSAAQCSHFLRGGVLGAPR